MSRWEMVRLGDVCSIKHGYAFKGKDITSEKVDKILVTPGNFQIGGGLKFSKNKYYTGDIPPEYILKEDSLIVTMTDLSKNGDTLGFSGLIPSSSKYIFLHNQRIGLVNIFSDKVDLNFIYWKMRDPNYQKYIVNSSTGSTVKHTSPTRILEYSFYLPPLEEQKRIAAILSSLDDKIEVNNQINKNLEEQAQAIFKSWFVDFEPFGGVMPSDWREVTLNNACSLISKGITPKYNESSEEIVINQKCIRNNKINLRLSRRHTPKKINEKWLQFGDVLINSTGAGTLGRAAQSFYSKDNLTVDSHVTIIRPKNEIFLYYIGLWCMLNENYFIGISTGSTGQTDLPRERLESSLITLPSQEILQKFNNGVKSIQCKIFSSQFENENLENMRNTLLPKLMNGEITV